ncbi:unnamed protein product [Cyprideis torosa]|uniref:Uncharacterized protein n=1 Tax=Cyprideis torosa TaxID=163714 RepID=A0A7R8WCE8_9CRUS|nr:unnamed protein product [Cyprideis torosa]CAG0893371.1 unnamed protein product [Cyprideis torosa]
MDIQTDYLGYGFSALVGLGGVIGYLKAGSIPSLAAGLGFGALIAVAAWQTSHDPRDVRMMLGASGFLAVLMGYRAYRTGKVMPAGLVCAASTFMLLRSLNRWAFPPEVAKVAHPR